MTGLPESFCSRGVSCRDYHLITPANRALSALPELAATDVVKLVTPRRAPAAFAQYLLLMKPGGGSERSAVGIDRAFEHCFYGLIGAAALRIDGVEQVLAPGRFAYVPEGCALALDNPTPHPAQVLWIKRRPHPVVGIAAPEVVLGDRACIDEPEYQPGLYRKVLFGEDDPRYDFTLITMRFEPGVDLLMTELHEEEHGLYMSAGRGTYLLGSDIHAVEEADFIYMAPYCPQAFVADPLRGAEYLLYKDVQRDGFTAKSPRSAPGGRTSGGGRGRTRA